MNFQIVMKVTTLIIIASNSENVINSINTKQMKHFFQEHLHTDSETRLITEGVAYFDIRKPDTDEWVRIELKDKEMISLPAGIYHRFTPDISVSCLRFRHNLLQIMLA